MPSDWTPTTGGFAPTIALEASKAGLIPTGRAVTTRQLSRNYGTEAVMGRHRCFQRGKNGGFRPLEHVIPAVFGRHEHLAALRVSLFRQADRGK
jgi:hypothetical protein